MIPLRDNIPSRTTPFVNYALIAACVVVFLLQLADRGGGSFVEGYGMIPARVLGEDAQMRDVVLERTREGTRLREVLRPVAPAAVPDWLTLLTCIFLHGGWLHLLSNVWILYIFGDNVEDRLGHWGYLAFYLGCGVLASVAHLGANAESAIPTVGASGAIAAVMGAYFVLYPRATVVTLVPLIIIFDIWVLPAPIFLGVWFGLQLLQGTWALTGPQMGGVAWWAHIGGFVAGVAVALLLSKTHRARPPVVEVRPRTRGFTRYGGYRVLPRRHRRW